jgi:hypothetical protein
MATISIERKAGAGSYSVVHTGDYTSNPWLDTGPFTDSVTYTYRAAVDGGDYSSECPIVFMTVQYAILVKP